MLITKFNKLIHNKLVWAAFAILVSLSMVGLFAPTSRRNGDKSETTDGTLFGKPVEHSELMQARLFVQDFQTSRSGEKDPRQVEEQAWTRIAIRRYAEKLGLSVSNQELSDTIARDPSFAVNGAFSRQRYQQLIERQMGIPISTFEDYLREDLLIRKVQTLLSSSLWIAPDELEQSVKRFTDLFTIDIVELTISNLTADISASDKDIRDFYDENPDLFKAPEKRSVCYVEWPVAEIARTVNVSEAQIQDAYDRDIEKYSTTDTNTMTVSYTPINEVSNSISEVIAAKEAVSIANEYAMEFLYDLSMLEESDAVSIHSVAAKRGMTVHTSDFFTVAAPVPGISAGLNFNQAAFQLDPQVPEKTYSRTVIGDSATYVMTWYTNRPAYLQAFEDVKDDAKVLADGNAKELAFETRLADIREKLQAAVKENKTFKETAEAMKLTVNTVGPFSVYSADPKEISYFSEIAPAMLVLATGEVSEPVRTDDATLILHLAKRDPGDQAEAISLKPEITRMLQSNRMRMHFATWSEHLLATARGTSPKTKTVALEPDPETDIPEPVEVEQP